MLTWKHRVFKVRQENFTTSKESSNFEPIIPVTRHDADTTIIFLSGNGVIYANSVPDDWYRVSTSPVDAPTTVESGTVAWSAYLPSEPASPLGCAIQHQFCNSAFGNSGCGPLSSLRDAIAGVAPFFDTDYTAISVGLNNGTAGPKAAGISHFAWMFLGFDKAISAIFSKLGPAALLSEQNLLGTDQGPLPPNQWQQDVTYAWNISLALIQGSIVDAAYGPTNPDYLPSWVKFKTPSLLKLCNNQVRIAFTHFVPLIFELTKIVV